MSANDRDAYIAGMRQLMDILEANPGLPLPFEGRSSAMTFHFLNAEDPRAAMAAAARTLPCKWDKRVWSGSEDRNYFDLSGQIAGARVKLSAFRDAVCTRVVTGTEEREIEETVTPAVIRKVVKPVEVVEWQCGSLLAERTADPPPEGGHTAQMGGF